MKLHEIILSHGAENDATQYPFWGICSYTRGREVILHAGIWFNRKDAEDYHEAKAHNFPKKSFVYCFSAHHSWHMKELYLMAGNELRKHANN